MAKQKQITEKELDQVSGGPHIRNWWGISRQEVTDPTFRSSRSKRNTSPHSVVNPDSM